MSSGPDTDEGADVRTPRWVKVSVSLTLVALVLAGIVLLFGGGHGPSRHASTSSAMHA